LRNGRRLKKPSQNSRRRLSYKKGMGFGRMRSAEGGDAYGRRQDRWAE